MAYSTSQRGNQWCPPRQQKTHTLFVLARKLRRCLICWLGPNMVTGLDRRGGDVSALGICWQLSWICGRERVEGQSGDLTFCLLARMPGRNGKVVVENTGFQLYSCGMSLKTLMFQQCWQLPIIWVNDYRKHNVLKTKSFFKTWKLNVLWGKLQWFDSSLLLLATNLT